GRLKATTALISANYQNYVNVYNNYIVGKDRTWVDKWGCGTSTPEPAPTDAVLLKHLYGWGPFVKGCATNANQFADTPGYEPSSATPYTRIKTNFDELQYWFFFKQTDDTGNGWIKTSRITGNSTPTCRWSTARKT